jgi:6-phosphogluconolactonase (cycloisomerase 2 family)
MVERTGGSRHGRFRVLYATNWASNDISALRLDRDGTLRGSPRLFPVARGAMNPLVAVLSPSEKHLYVSNWGSGDVSSYRVGSRGRLTAEATTKPAGPPVSNASGMAISKDGRHLFLAAFNAGGPGTVSSFAVGRDGRLSALNTVAAHGDGPAGIALAPDGRTLYVANMMSGDVSAFAVRDGGSLRWIQTIASGAGAFFPALTPDGRILVVANATSNDLSVFRVTSQHRLHLLTGPTDSGGDGPRGVVISPEGRLVYVAHYNGGTGPGSVSAFKLRGRGRLVQVGDAVPTGGNGAEAMVFDTSTRRLFVANFNTGELGSVSIFDLGQNGRVSLVGEPVPTGGKEPDFGGLAIFSGKH